MTHEARTVRRARLATSVAFGLQGFVLASMLTQLPQYKEMFGLSEAMIVTAVVTISVIAAFGSFLAEKLTAATSSKTTLRVALALIALFGGATGLAPDAVAYYALLGMYGIGVGMVDAASNMQAVAVQHAKGRFILSSFHACWSVGAIGGALAVSGTAALGVSARVTQVGVGVVVALTLVALGPALLDRREVQAVEPARVPTTFTVAARPFIMLCVAMALFYAVDFSIGNWSTLYVKDELLASAETAALSVAAYQIAALIARLTGDYWVSKFGEITVVRIGAAIGVVGMIVVVLAHSPALAIAGFTIVGLGVPVIAPICFSTAGRMAAPGQVDAVIARINLFNYVGTVAGGGLVGIVATFSNLRTGFVIPLALCALLVLLARAFDAPRPLVSSPGSAP